MGAAYDANNSALTVRSKHGDCTELGCFKGTYLACAGLCRCASPPRPVQPSGALEPRAARSTGSKYAQLAC